MNETLSGLTFGQSISRVLSRYATFSGRATRSEYWWFYLFAVIVSTVMSILQGLGAGDGTGFNVFMVLSMLVSLALLLPSLAVAVRRLHDTNRSGWWILIGLIPLVGLIVMIVFLVTDSNPTDNRFGPAPTPAAQS